MPKSLLERAIARSGKQLVYVSVTPGAINPNTNRPGGSSTTETNAFACHQRQARESAVGGVEIILGDEVYLVEATALESASVSPKVGDWVRFNGSSETYRRLVVGYEPIRGPNSEIWAHRVLLRGPIDRE